MEIIIGILAGICTGIGIGGGAILVLLLDILLGLNQHASQAVNLICFIPSAIISIIYNFNKKNINFRGSVPILLFGIIGAAIGSIISKNMDVFYLKKCFGIFLIIITIYEIVTLYNFVKVDKKNKKNK